MSIGYMGKILLYRSRKLPKFRGSRYCFIKTSLYK